MNPPTKANVPFQTTCDSDVYNRMPTLKQLLEENGYDLSTISWKYPNVRIIVPMSTIEIADYGMRGWGLSFKDLDNSKRLFSDAQIDRYWYACSDLDLFCAQEPYNCFQTPHLLEVNVNLYTFYEDPFPYDFDKAPRIHPSFIAAALWNAFVVANAP